MKKIALYGLAFTLVAVFVFGVLPATAAKPQDVIEKSNGFPSGEHFNLNIHGKNLNYQCSNCELCTDPATCDPLVLECNVVNIPEYTEDSGVDNHITYVSGKKVKIDVLTVFDSCSDYYDGDSAEVWLPYEQEGYWVFARALGKPGKGEEERYIILENENLEAYPLVEDVESPGDIILGLGMITQQGEFKMDSSGELYRFDETSVKGKGKSKAKDITGLFLWTGLVFHPDLDVNLDGVVDELDVIADTCTGDTNHDGTIDNAELLAWCSSHADPDDVNGDTIVNALDVIADTCPYDANQDGVISYDGDFDINTFPDCEFEDWLYDNKGDDPNDPLWEYYEEAWVFTIADLVYLNQVVTNEGIKNLQIRFYPVDTTEFIPAE